MQRSSYQIELWCFLAFVGTCGLLGLLCGAFFLGLSLAMGLYSVRFFYQTRRLAACVYKARRAPIEPEHLSGLWQDIAEDVHVLQSRHEKEKLRLQAVVVRVQEMTTALTDGVILIDRRDNIEWWNQAAGQLFGFQDVDRGHKLTNLIRHPKFVLYFDERKYQQPLELNSSRQQDQHLQFQVHSFGQGERLVVVRDVTRVFKLEQMRKDFVANVSHELRTPLTVLRGYLETLADSPLLPMQWTPAFAAMEQQSQRMTLLIQDLITLAKLETDEREASKEPVALEPLLALVVVDAKTLSGNRAHQIVVRGDSDTVLLGNAGELRSAFANLVYNAVNYSPDGAAITIHCERKATGFELYVKDNGIGIDPKHLPRLTERFYRVDPSRAVISGGTGLGLAIVKHVLLRHNAELQINSMVGKGSTFYCCFPKEAIINPVSYD